MMLGPISINVRVLPTATAILSMITDTILSSNYVDCVIFYAGCEEDDLAAGSSFH